MTETTWRLIHACQATRCIHRPGRCLCGRKRRCGQPSIRIHPPSTTQSSPTTAAHWASVGFYYTYKGCAADGAYLVANDPGYGGWKCLFVSDEDLWHLEVYVGPS
jgi:hypothetical protein